MVWSRSPRVSSELEVGDTVIATDPQTGLSAARAVTAVHVNLDTALADVIVIDDDGDVSVIHTTQHHPFWNVSADSWSDVVDLDSGDQLRSPDGSSLTVLAVRSLADEQWMWNLTVADIHTFYVANGDEPILVHNCLQNQLPESLEAELDAAAAVGARPIRAGTEGFDEAIDLGDGTIK